MKKNNLFIDLDKLDETIAKLEQIKKLLEQIQGLQKDSIHYPVAPQPEPIPYIPQPSRTSPIPNDPWGPKIWC